MVDVTEGSTPVQIRRTIVQSTEPFLTVKDLAEQLSVTPRTIRNNIDEAGAHRSIKSQQVGQTTVYYKEPVEKPHYPRFAPSVNPIRQSVLGTRAEWLDAKARHFKSFSSTSGVVDRIRLYYALLDYAKRCGGLAYTPFGQGESQILLGDDSDLSEEDVRFVDSEVGFFEAPWVDGVELEEEPQPPAIGENGEVRGISGLLQFETYLQAALGSLFEEHSPDAHGEELTLADLPQDDLDRLFPSAADIVHTGEVIDEFTVDMHGLWWSN